MQRFTVHDAMNNPYQAQIDLLQQQIEANQLLLSDPELGGLAQQEITQLEEQKKMLEDAAAQLENFSDAGPDPSSTRHVNCIIEFRPGAGGEEAKIWADNLMRMYLRFAERLRLKVEFLDDEVLKFKGKATLEGSDEQLTAYEIFQYESGVHRVQRVPETEAQGRIHTSTASVAVLPEVHPGAVVIREEDLEWQFMRAGGAGGQHVNKTNSAVRLIHKPSGLVTNARQERQQAQNRQIALDMLRSLLWELEEEKRLAEIGEARSSIGRAQRAEKIRTYNYPQNRVTDHRIKESWHSLETILEGYLDDVVLTTRKMMIEGVMGDEQGDESVDISED